MLLHPADLIAEVDGDVEVSANENTNFENFGDLPQEGDDDDDDHIPGLLLNPEEPLNVDDQIDSSELADLLEDEERQRAIDEVPNEPVGDPEEEDSTDDEDANIDNNCMSDQGSVEVDEVPELTSDEEGRPIRSSRKPERYDPSTGRSYA